MQSIFAYSNNNNHTVRSLVVNWVEKSWVVGCVVGMGLGIGLVELGDVHCCATFDLSVGRVRCVSFLKLVLFELDSIVVCCPSKSVAPQPTRFFVHIVSGHCFVLRRVVVIGLVVVK